MDTKTETDKKDIIVFFFFNLCNLDYIKTELASNYICQKILEGNEDEERHRSNSRREAFYIQLTLLLKPYVE